MLIDALFSRYLDTNRRNRLISELYKAAGTDSAGAWEKPRLWIPWWDKETRNDLVLKENDKHENVYKFLLKEYRNRRMNLGPFFDLTGFDSDAFISDLKIQISRLCQSFRESDGHFAQIAQQHRRLGRDLEELLTRYDDWHMLDWMASQVISEGDNRFLRNMCILNGITGDTLTRSLVMGTMKALAAQKRPSLFAAMTPERIEDVIAVMRKIRDLPDSKPRALMSEALDVFFTGYRLTPEALGLFTDLVQEHPEIPELLSKDDYEPARKAKPEQEPE